MSDLQQNIQQMIGQLVVENAALRTKNEELAEEIKRLNGKDDGERD